MSESESNSEKPHPPVPPSNHRIAREIDNKGSRVIERETQDTDCPQCGGTIEFIVEKTGETMVASWDPQQFNSEEYDLTTTYEREERYNRCKQCGWRVYL